MSISSVLSLFVSVDATAGSSKRENRRRERDDLMSKVAFFCRECVSNFLSSESFLVDGHLPGGHAGGDCRRWRWGGSLRDNGVELARLLARVRPVLPVQKGDGELQVLRRRVLPYRLQMHVQGEVLPCSFQLMQLL